MTERADTLIAAGPSASAAMVLTDRPGDAPIAGERRCLVTRTVAARHRLLRLVLDPAGRVMPDIDERLPGRGMWLSADRDVVNKAVERRLFGKAAGRSATVLDDLADQVERLLTRRFFDGVGLARRAGQLVMGFDQVQAWLSTAAAAVLIAADDGAADGRRKLRRLAAGVPLIVAGSREELGAAVGRESLVHAALPSGRLAARLRRDAGRLAGFRTDVAIENSEGTPSRRNEPKGTTETP